MKIEILGTGCAKCTTLYNNAKEAIGKSGKFCQLEKVDDINKILSYGVMSTPALVINSEVKIAGKVASVEEIIKIISN